ncbi:MAG: HIT domain-containing protein [Chloroflexi bacterium]|nr:HIT domain-containing protein [Chloroflexota bacterium]
MSTDSFSDMLNHRINVCKRGCPLCNEMSNQDALSNLLGIYKTHDEKFLLQTSHFVAMPDIFPLVPGHTILLTRDHVLSMAQIPIEWYDELKKVKSELAIHLSKQFGTLFCFEHGDADGEMTSGVCIKHAHLHFIPAVISIEEWVKPYSNQPIEIVPIEYPAILNGIKGSYIYYENLSGSGLFVYPNKPLPEQFIRRVVAESCHLPEWDWKKTALPFLL